MKQCSHGVWLRCSSSGCQIIGSAFSHVTKQTSQELIFESCRALDSTIHNEADSEAFQTLRGRAEAIAGNFRGRIVKCEGFVRNEILLAKDERMGSQCRVNGLSEFPSAKQCARCPFPNNCTHRISPGRSHRLMQRWQVIWGTRSLQIQFKSV